VRRILFALTLLSSALAVQADEAKNPPTDKEIAAFADGLLAKAYPADGPGAVVLVARGDTVLYRGARGLANVELGVPLNPQQSFRIGSVTKQFASASLLKLIEDGKAKLEDPLSKFLPDYPNGAKITVHQLLNHTSGVKSYTEIPEIMERTIRLDLSTKDLVASFKDQKPTFAPGENWAYNNSGYVLVGAVIEAASGKPWHQYLTETLLAPNGLTHTRFGANDVLIVGMASGYSVNDGKLAPARYISMTQPHAAGALVSTVDDLFHWNRALHGGKLLKADSYTEMTTPTGKAIPAKYGFGIERNTLRGHLRLQHNGGIFGYASALIYVPDAELSVAVLQNADQTVDGKGDPTSLATVIGAYALGDPYPEAKPIAVDADVLKGAEGVYRIDADNTRVLRVVDGKLTAQRTGGERLELMPIAVDSFLYAGGQTWFKLERDQDGKLTGMRMYQDGEGEGAVAALTSDPLPAERASIDVPVEQLQRLVGDYTGSGMTMHITVDGKQLKTQLDGQPVFDVFAETPNRFFLTVVDATLEFAHESGKVTKVTLKQGTAVIELERK
jgi:CubicO group peptidase (beta-lactamase class C family)